MKFPLVSIIIANWNGKEVLKDCLDSLVKINYPNWELVLVDNGSTDGSERLVENYQTKIKKIVLVKNNSNLGFARANNQGYGKSKGEYLLLLNNDTKVKPDLINVLVSRIEQDKYLAVVQPKIFLMDKPGYLDNAGSFFTRIGFLDHWGFMQKDGPEYDKEQEIFSAKGACLLIRREVVDKIGLFDNDFGSYFEETDFCWRAEIIGYKVLYYPKTFIYHKVGFTTRRQNVLDINFNSYKNRICSQLKNLQTYNLFLILIPHLIVSLGIAALFLLRLQPKNSIIILKSISWNINSLSATWKKRNEIQKNRTVSDNELFRKLSRKVNWKKFFLDFKRIEEDIKR
ncbi:MAG: glycosyltransferase family 2 protein [Candidatus Daviesbacteria bacterium]|nr:glycosyltransferase family 2 protein [Candidatus Daviesbacteria bacterium]